MSASRRRRRSKNRSAGGPSLVLAVALGAAAGLAAGALARPDWLSTGLDRIRQAMPGSALELRRVEFVGTERLVPEALLERAALEAPLRLADADPRHVCEAIASHPGVAECAALRLPPDRLIVALVERTPLAAIAGPRSGAGAGRGSGAGAGRGLSGEAIDTNGVRFPLPSSEAEGLPLVHGDPALALSLLLDAAAAGFRIRSIEVRNAEDLIVRPEERDVRLRIGLDTTRALDGWQKLLASGLLDTQRAREVDLRFRGNAVLRDWNAHDKEGG